MLPEFLAAIKALEIPDDVEPCYVEPCYYFLVNDSTDDSLDILYRTVIGKDPESPAWPNARVAVIETGIEPDLRAKRSERGIYTHLQHIRQRISTEAVKAGCDRLFCVDSDIIVRPDTLKALLTHDKDFVAAMCANAQGNWQHVNAVQVSMGGVGPWSDPPNWKAHRATGNGLVKVGATGACFVASAKLLKACSYLYEPEAGSNAAELLKTQPGEDCVYALSCYEQGFTKWLDESHRVWHCMAESQLAEYVAAKKKYKSKTVQTLADRAWQNTAKPGG